VVADRRFAQLETARRLGSRDAEREKLGDPLARVDVRDRPVQRADFGGHFGRLGGDSVKRLGGRQPEAIAVVAHRIGRQSGLASDLRDGSPFTEEPGHCLASLRHERMFAR
jgi:hypothetical protein